MITEQLITEFTPEDNATWRLKLIGSVAGNHYSMRKLIEGKNSLLNKLTETHAQKFIIDLSTTKRLDSQGLRLLLSIHKELSQNDIQIILQNPNLHLYRVLQIMSFDHLFKIEFSEE